MTPPRWPPTIHSPEHPGYGTTARTRVLLALVAEHRDHGWASMRSVAARADVSLAATVRALRQLHADGLAQWEPDTEGTLRPTVYLAAMAPTNRSTPHAHPSDS